MKKLVYLMFIIIIFSGASLAEVTDSCGTKIPEGIDLSELLNPQYKEALVYYPVNQPFKIQLYTAQCTFFAFK